MGTRAVAWAAGLGSLENGDQDSSALCPLEVKYQFLKKSSTSCSGPRRTLPVCCPTQPISLDALCSAVDSQFPESA